METEQSKAVVHRMQCHLRDFVIHIWSCKDLHVILAYTHPRFPVSGYQFDFIWSSHPNFVPIPLLVIKVKWCCLHVIGTRHWQIYFLNRCKWRWRYWGEAWIHTTISIYWDMSEKRGRFSEVHWIKKGKFSSTFERSKQGVVSVWFRAAWRRNSAFVASGKCSAVYFIKICEWQIIWYTRQWLPEVYGSHSK